MLGDRRGPSQPWPPYYTRTSEEMYGTLSNNTWRQDGGWWYGPNHDIQFWIYIEIVSSALHIYMISACLIRLTKLQNFSNSEQVLCTSSRSTREISQVEKEKKYSNLISDLADNHCKGRKFSSDFWTCRILDFAGFWIIDRLQIFATYVHCKITIGCNWSRFAW